MTPLPDDPLEREFKTLTRKLGAARGFCFVAFFVDDRRASRRLAAWLGDWLAGEGRPLILIAADTPAELVATTMGGLFHTVPEDADRHGLPVFWVEAFRGKSDAEWDAQRRMLLMRMNERRSRFETQLAAPLVLLLPAGAQRETASLAPDLWHVRLHSAALGLGAVPADDDRALAAAPRSFGVFPYAAAAKGVDSPPPEVVYWHSSRSAEGDAGPEGAAAFSDVSIVDGVAAVRAWLRAGNFERAADVGTEVVGLARRQRGREQGDDGIARDFADLDLSIALTSWGDALTQAGRDDEAIAAFEEAAALAERVVDGSGGPTTPGLVQAAAALLALGDALSSRGQPDVALEKYARGLELLRHRPFGADGSALLATFLGRIGEAALALNDARRALAASEDAVAVWRRLRRSDGDDPSRLRSLAVALIRFGDASWSVGQGEEAVSAYGEARALLENVASRPGGAEDVFALTAAVQARLLQAENADAPPGADGAPSAPE